MSQAKDRRVKTTHLAKSGFGLRMPLKGLDELERLEDVAAHALEHRKPGERFRIEEFRELVASLESSSYLHIFPVGLALPALAAHAVEPYAESSSDGTRLWFSKKARTNPLALALKHSEDNHADALVRAGVATETVDIMRSWFETLSVGNAIQSEIQTSRLLMLSRMDDLDDAVHPLVGRDPSEALGIAAYAEMLGLSTETVRRREREGHVISFLSAHRKRGRSYPVFQTWEGISGEPLREVLSHLPDAGAQAFAFFTAINDTLGGLTPIEALVGKLTTVRDVGDGKRLLEEDDAARRAAVIAAADLFSKY